jgi:arsenite methyltransferase
MEDKDIKKIVRENYGKVASANSCCCSSREVSCCGNTGMEKEISAAIGYSAEDMNMVPQGSNLGLGCGNPLAFASIKKGYTVLDLGSGAGFDCFLASHKVGPEGKVIGIDMTSEMIKKAGENAENGGYKNVEFRLGEIENLPVEDGSIDTIISNCVVNLSPDKDRVFKEAYRALKPGGRLVLSDIVLTRELPSSIKNNMSAYVSCLSGALLKDDYIKSVKQAGFTDIKIHEENVYPANYIISGSTQSLTQDEQNLHGNSFENSVLSIKMSALKG